MASINKQNISGDLDVSRNLATGGSLNVTSKATFKGNVKVEGFLDAPNLKVPFKGVFDSDTELNVAYPKPANGWYAYIKSVTDANRLETAGEYYIARAYGFKWVTTGEIGTLEVTTEDSKYEVLEEKVIAVQTEADCLWEAVYGGEDAENEGLESRVETLENDVKENHLNHVAENLEDFSITTENGKSVADSDNGLRTNLLLALNKNEGNGRLKLAAESAFIETSDFEIDEEGTTITRKEGSHGGSVYLTTPNGIIQRATLITLRALKRIDETNDSKETNGEIHAYTTSDDGFQHNGSKVLTARDLTEIDEKLQKLSDAISDIIGDDDTDGDSLSSLKALFTLLQNGKWGGSVRFNGITELGDEELIEGTLDGEAEGVLWLTDKKMFVAVDAEVVVDCGCETVIHKYYTDWEGSRFYMEAPGEEGALWAEKVYIHGGCVYVWKECESQLVKAGGRLENVLSNDDIDEIMEDFVFLEIGNPIYKIEAKGDAQLYLDAENNGLEATIKGSVDIKDITEQDVNSMFEQAEKELSK